MSEIRKFFFKAREDVFMDPQGGIKFNAPGLESMLKEVLGDMKLCDVKHPRYCYLPLSLWNHYIIHACM